MGNSFSQDAQRYLSRIAAHDGVKLKMVISILGCTLRTHYLNMLDNSAAYSSEYGGESTGIKVLIPGALSSDDCDVVTLQQASRYGVTYDSYAPYIKELADEVREYCPRARL